MIHSTPLEQRSTTVLTQAAICTKEMCRRPTMESGEIGIWVGRNARHGAFDKDAIRAVSTQGRLVSRQGIGC